MGEGFWVPYAFTPYIKRVPDCEAHPADGFKVALHLVYPALKCALFLLFLSDQHAPHGLRQLAKGNTATH